MPRKTKATINRERKATKVAPLNMRTTPEMRARLERAASESGRSLVKEVEKRIERSFEIEGGVYRDFGGEDQYRMCRMFADIANSIKFGAFKSENAHWTNSKGAFLAALGAWKAVMLIILRDDFIFSILPLDEIEKLGAKIGSRTAAEVAKAVEGAGSRK